MSSPRRDPTHLTMRQMQPTDHQHPSSSERAPPPPPLAAAVGKDDGAPSSSSVVVKIDDLRCHGDWGAAARSAAVDVCLAAAAVAGAALLAWWAVAFHPSYAQLWMVPLGLVLAGTPPVVCLALRFSPDARAPPPPPGKDDGSSSAPAAAPPPLVAVVIDKQ